MTKTICPNCDERFERLGSHWVQSDCDYPSFTKEQLDILTGLMMGDGSLNKNRVNSSVNCRSNEFEYLEYLDELFGVLSTRVTVERTAKQLAENEKSTIPNRSSNPSDYSDVYVWQTRRHPELSQYEDWYTDEGKIYPEDIKLSPEVLTHWYIGDGTLIELEGDGNFSVKISVCNERDNLEKVYNYFRDADLPEPNRSHNFERSNGTIGCHIVWNESESTELMSYMNGPIPGYEYKFPYQKV